MIQIYKIKWNAINSMQTLQLLDIEDMVACINYALSIVWMTFEVGTSYQDNKS